MIKGKNVKLKIKKKHPIRNTLLVILILAVGLGELANYLLTISTVPSAMEKLPLFETITEMCYGERVYTEDITANYNAEMAATQNWYNRVEHGMIYVESEDGYKLAAMRFYQTGANADSHKWVLVLHGYTGSKAEMYPFACWYHGQGFQVITPDLRCQGESEGDFIGMGYTDAKDCMQWINYILEQDPEAEIVLHGQSMGAATALMMSAREDLPDNVKAVVSDAAYTDAYSMFGDKIKDWFHLPAFPFVDLASLFLRFRAGYGLKQASPLKAVVNSKVPTLFIHGDEDNMISVNMAYELYEAEAAEKELLIIEGAGHAQTQEKDPEKYYGTISEFLEPLLQ